MYVLFPITTHNYNLILNMKIKPKIIGISEKSTKK